MLVSAKVWQVQADKQADIYAFGNDAVLYQTAAVKRELSLKSILIYQFICITTLICGHPSSNTLTLQLFGDQTSTTDMVLIHYFSLVINAQKNDSNTYTSLYALSLVPLCLCCRVRNHSTFFTEHLHLIMLRCY